MFQQQISSTPISFHLGVSPQSRASQQMVLVHEFVFPRIGNLDFILKYRYGEGGPQGSYDPPQVLGYPPALGQIVEVYGEEAMIRQHAVKWCHFFQSGRQDVENCNMAGNVQPSSSPAEINTARIEEIIQNDRRVTLSEISHLSYGSVQHIVSDVLRYSETVQ
ncbi:histone-lysine N-methyltransferase SETMAR [Trichonephila clavipes]|nr:histone-lysine N-methyltransferase SETMAR [Trichonephila clavipes]